MTKIITTMHWKLPQEAEDYFNEHRDLHFPVFGGGKQKMESLNDKWLFDNCTPDDARKDNISMLNPLLNEWTTIYLVHKNLDLLPAATQNIGHNHYRRVFTQEQLKDINTVDGIIAKPIPLCTAGYRTTIKLQYKLCHYEEDFNILRKLVEEAEPVYGQKLYDKDIWEAWSNLNMLIAPQNLFVFRREVFNIFCSDLFPILLKLPTMLTLEERDDYQKRACGFLMERLVSYWCCKKATKDGYRFIEQQPIEHMDWKPEGATDKRGMTNGVFTGDQSLPKIQEWLKQKGLVKNG